MADTTSLESRLEELLEQDGFTCAETPAHSPVVEGKVHVLRDRQQSAQAE